MITIRPTLRAFLSRLKAFAGKQGGRIGKILVYGDSNCARDYPGNQPEWPAIMQKMAGRRMQVFNCSIDGRTTGFDEGKLNGRVFLKTVLGEFAELSSVVIMLGTNDFKKIYGDVSAGESLANISAILDCLADHDPKIRPVLVTPPPVRPNETMAGDAAGKTALLAILLRHLAAARNAALVELGSRIKFASHMAADGVHLNSRGRKLAATLVYRKLEAALNSENELVFHDDFFHSEHDVEAIC